MGKSIILILIIALFIENGVFALRNQGLECYQCASFGSTGDPTCLVPVVGKTQVVKCSNENDIKTSEDELSRKYAPLLTRIEHELGRRRSRRSSAGVNNTDIEVGQPTCFKLLFSITQKPAVVQGCTLAEVEKANECSHSEFGISACYCTEKCVPRQVTLSGRSQPAEIPGQNPQLSEVSASGKSSSGPQTSFGSGKLIFMYFCVMTFELSFRF